MNAQQRRFERLAKLVRKRLAKTPACHDVDHTVRVVRNARRLAALEPEADLAVVVAAAWLHDVARAKEMKRKGKVCHAQLGAAKAPRLLRKCGFRDEAFIAHVAACVRTHRFRGHHRPATIEAKIVYDADKLDSLGAIGLGRAFHFAGGVGARVHNRKTEALAGESYGHEDSAYREYLVKLRRIPGRMLTRAGRRLATERARFMAGFFRQLREETGMR